MKKFPLVTRLTVVAFAATLLMIGCKKENSDTLSAQEEEQAATFSSESEVDSEIAFDDVYDNVMGVNSDVGLGGVVFSGAPPLLYLQAGLTGWTLCLPALQ